ncbi:CRISPR-associated protein Cas4 [Rugamonas sp. CCM 8940]|uniref:CRISPR-associated protein Cas4 n=1 Tax=Rugamonas sp. CCM 8940 TaxID=2765359 RepID=UPI0018F36465|nr:CRISPR-associated protein Cas4 [Rugamonas sp. CCM 8940]MBJ7312343.1 CRISPR-associated protein Cas4 [Rugamonas sp. CCM 8940]
MEDEELIPLSALQHFLYCPRQCALIHVEQMWAENRLTAEGKLLHERADQAQTGQRHGVRTATAMPLVNRDLGIVGIADVVEFHTGEAARVMPVEYKRGRPKQHRADEVQLCAQGLCLETMLGLTIEEGALFYGQSRRRVRVMFDATLRTLTLSIIAATRALIEAGQTPQAEYAARRCDACSLIDICQPRLLGRTVPVNAWLAKQLEDD